MADLNLLWQSVKRYFDSHMAQRISAKLPASPAQWFQEADLDSDGEMKMGEWIEAMLVEGSPAAHAFLSMMVQLMDSNSDGMIQTQEKHSIISSHLGPMEQVRPRTVAESRFTDHMMESLGFPVSDEEELLQNEEFSGELGDEEFEENDFEETGFTPEQLSEELISVVNKMEILRMRFVTPGNMAKASQVDLEIIEENAPGIFQSVDLNKDGHITAKELNELYDGVKPYLEQTLDRPGRMVERDIWNEKLGAQEDGSVKLTARALAHLMTHDLQGKLWESLIACLFYTDIDSDLNGHLSRKEMLAFKKADMYRLFDLPTMKPEDPNAES